MIKITNLSFSFYKHRQKYPVLKNISLNVSPGECFGLMGNSGSGKSTILNILIGLLKGWSGQVKLGGIPVTHANKEYYQMVQMVFQDCYGSLHPQKSVYQALAEPLIIHKIENKPDKINKVLSQIGLSQEYLYRYPHQLSGGQRQRVSIARALILGSKILLLDEPTSSLDVSVQAEILNLLKMLKFNSKLTYIFVSHDPNVLAHMCDRIAILDNGCLTSVFDKETFIKKQKQIVNQ